MTKRDAKVGTVVKTNMGVRRTGVIVSWLSQDKCTDGTYRAPLTDRERRQWVSVRWNDGTQGYSSVVHLRACTCENNGDYCASCQASL